MTYLNTKFQFYPGKIYIPEPLGTVTLMQFISAQKNPQQKTKDIFNQIAEAERTKQLELKAKLKQNNLYYFTPCARTDGLGRSYSNLTEFTGLCVLDFDHIDNAEELKQWIFTNLKSCVCVYLSPSKRGVKAIVRIPVVSSVEEFKEYFYGLAERFQYYEGFDGSSQNILLPLFLSWDENILWREDAVVWETRGAKIDKFPTVSLEDFSPPENINEEDTETVKTIIEKSIDKITDSGHFILRSSALALGGYVASNYISFEDAEDFIYALIESNSYLKKGISGYKKTATQMLVKGASSPLLLDKHKQN